MSMTPDYFDYGYANRMPFGDLESVIGVVMVVYMAACLVLFAYGILVYILQSLGMYTIANRRGIHHPWLAWLPIANLWLLGSISDQYQYVAKGRVRNRRKVLLGLSIAAYVPVIPMYSMSFVLGLYSGLGQNPGEQLIGSVLTIIGLSLLIAVISIVLAVFVYIALYDLYVSSKPNNAVAFLVLSIFFPFLQPYFVFVCRKKDMGMPPRKSRISQQPPQTQQEEPVEESPAQPFEETAPTYEEEVTEEDFADEE